MTDIQYGDMFKDTSDGEVMVAICPQIPDHPEGLWWVFSFTYSDAIEGLSGRGLSLDNYEKIE